MNTVPASIEHIEEDKTDEEQKDNPGKFWRKEERQLVFNLEI